MNSNELGILISDRTFKVGDQEIILSKPKWTEIAAFAGVVESLVSHYTTAENDTQFITAILQDSAQEIREGINNILKMCLPSDQFGEGGFDTFIAQFTYDVVFALLFEIWDMNKNFFVKSLENLGVTATKEEQA